MVIASFSFPKNAKNGLRANEVRFLLFPIPAAPGAAAAIAAAAPFFLLAEAADGMAHRKTQHRQNDDISHGFLLIHQCGRWHPRICFSEPSDRLGLPAPQWHRWSWGQRSLPRS